ncbi:hypothetical protein TrLO_g7239 [Triparma laevis f. longispina]|uniref:Uncharacterized protein n=1 Tax=Triparma laevis f. longispina TaxID=1714387 RepID=A0A9W7EE49_9STRA|nr:hypothetical protein TrLO_g7239 [Triparma laevis f. longispina]
MSKSAASESQNHNESHKTGVKRGAGDEEKQDEEIFLEVSSAPTPTTLTTVSTVPAPVNDFMHSIEFKRLFVPLVHDQTLMALRVLNKEWNGVADARIDQGVKSGALVVHGGKDISEDDAEALAERRELVTRVIFLLNITKVGNGACFWADNLAVVEIPEGVERIEFEAFGCCSSLNTVYFPTTLRVIGDQAFAYCESLDNVDLLHTNLHELGTQAFWACSGLKSMKIPDSLQTLGSRIFHYCSKLVPSSIIVKDLNGNEVCVSLSPLASPSVRTTQKTTPQLTFT